MAKSTPTIDLDTALELLGLDSGASDEQVRSAYMEQVQRHPPDRDPERFEQIRDAYNYLRDPAARARLVIEGPDPSAPLANLLQKTDPNRCFVGAQPWLSVLKEKRQ